MDLLPYPEEVLGRARGIRLLILDVDGVLTDGRLYFDAKGETLKVFHVRDGHGIKMAQRGGIEVALVSGRRSDAAEEVREAARRRDRCTFPDPPATSARRPGVSPPR